MALDNAQFMSELSITDPPGTDPLSEGDDQIRTSKRTQLQSFPNVNAAVTLTAAELNAAAIKSAVNVFTARNDFQHAPTRFADGSAATPGIAFLGSQTHGFFRIDSNTFGATVLGVQKMSWGVGAIQAAVPYGAVDTLADFPGYAFTNNNDMGMYRESADVLAFSVAGIRQARVFSTFWQFFQQVVGPVGSAGTPSWSFVGRGDVGMYSPALSSLTLVTDGLPGIELDTGQQTTVRKECTIQRNNDTQARTGWRYTDAAGAPQWAIYLGTSPTNTLAFQRYVAGAFVDVPFSIRQSNGLLRMPSLPTSSAGLIAGELWRNPVSPGFVAIV